MLVYKGAITKNLFVSFYKIQVITCHHTLCADITDILTDTQRDRHSNYYWAPYTTSIQLTV